MKKIILQIGRVDKNIDQNIKFCYGNKYYENPLSSFSLRDYFKDINDIVKVCLIYPVSLPLNENLKNKTSQDSNYNDFFKEINELLSDKNKIQKYFNDPACLFEKHPHSKLADTFLVVNSIGSYCGIKLDANLHEIILHILIFLINEYLSEQFDEIYIDISSGLNFYITALIESLRYFYVWVSLYNIWENIERIKSFISYTDPIIGRINDSFNIYTYDISFSVQFQSPINSEEIEKINNEIIVNSLNLKRELKRQANQYLEEFLVIFNCFDNSTPIYLYSSTYSKFEDILRYFQLILNRIIDKFKTNYIELFNYDFRNFIKFLLSFSFLLGLRKLMVENKINYKESKGTTIKNIDHFIEILKKLNLRSQSNFLAGEKRKNFEHKDFLSKYNELKKGKLNEWVYLRDLLEYGSKSSPINSRNFFSHAGFERNVTMIKIEDIDIEKDLQKLKIKYDDENLDQIENILKKSHKYKGD